MDIKFFTCTELHRELKTERNGQAEKLMTFEQRMVTIQINDWIEGEEIETCWDGKLWEG